VTAEREVHRVFLTTCHMTSYWYCLHFSLHMHSSKLLFRQRTLTYSSTNVRGKKSRPSMASSQTCGGMQRHRPAESNARKGLAGSPPEATSGHAAGSHGTVTRRRGSPSSQHPRRSPSARSPQWYLTATGGAPRSGVRSTATSCAEIAEVRGSESQLAGPPAWCAGSKGDAGRGQLELRA